MWSPLQHEKPTVMSRPGGTWKQGAVMSAQCPCVLFLLSPDSKNSAAHTGARESRPPQQSIGCAWLSALCKDCEVTAEESLHQVLMFWIPVLYHLSRIGKVSQWQESEIPLTSVPTFSSSPTKNSFSHKPLLGWHPRRLSFNTLYLKVTFLIIDVCLS